ncbi:MAG TPA: YciI family protein [Candidatus Saccharimonadales bacterium]|nr:YciI family protein [Candidatus Saccharimonadales bacterium]
MMDTNKQPIYYVLSLTTKYMSMKEVQEKASEALVAHVKRSRSLHQEGKVLMAGAFLDRPEELISTMIILSTREDAEEFVKGDPFVQKGMVKSWTIREWQNMFYQQNS